MRELADRLSSIGTSIFAEITSLALRTGAINLGQGDPEIPPPAKLLADAALALPGMGCRYPRTYGYPDLNLAVSEHQSRFYGLTYDPEDEITIVCGASEGIFASVLSIVDPGSEVLLFEPFYEFYKHAVEIAGAKAVAIPLLPGDFSMDLDRVAASISGRTKAVILNSPHNPTGRIFSEAELSGLAALCVEHDLYAITDEVYEHLWFSRMHRPLACHFGMRERTITVSSASKTFSVPGWRVGWVCASSRLTRGIRAVKTAATFCSPAAFQAPVAIGLREEDSFFEERRLELLGLRDFLHSGFEDLGCHLLQPEGSMFILVNFSPLGFSDGRALCRTLPLRCGVAAIPLDSFCVDPGPFASWVRFAFCKPLPVLEEALSRLGASFKGSGELPRAQRTSINSASPSLNSTST